MGAVWVLCEQPQLVDGPHIVTVKATAAGRTFWFDDITYTPSSNVSQNGVYILVDNFDPGIVYGSPWGALGGAANFTTGTELRFNFTGKGLSWFGFIPTEFSHNSTTASYSIDGGNPVTFRLNGLPQDTIPTVYNQNFFSTPALAAGPHTLYVVHHGTDKETHA